MRAWGRVRRVWAGIVLGFGWGWGFWRGWDIVVYVLEDVSFDGSVCIVLSVDGVLRDILPQL